jgi:hypothetical protein
MSTIGFRIRTVATGSYLVHWSTPDRSIPSGDVLLADFAHAEPSWRDVADIIVEPTTDKDRTGVIIRAVMSYVDRLDRPPAPA